MQGPGRHACLAGLTSDTKIFDFGGATYDDVTLSDSVRTIDRIRDYVSIELNMARLRRDLSE
jgi:hypothetical protein